MKKPKNSTEKIAVIGAGLGGLATAARLAARGFEVHVFDANTYPGGKATVTGAHGFVFDAGPSLFTMPQWVDEVFLNAGKDPRNYYTYKRLDTLCHYFFDDGTQLKAAADKQRFAEEIALKTTDGAPDVLRFLKHAARIYELTEKVFIRKSLHRLKTYLSKDTLKGLLNFGDIRAFSTMEKSIRGFFKDERNVQLFCRYATFNGSNPYLAPGTLNVIPHLEYGEGAFIPEGGIHDITLALYRLGKDLGVHFHLGTAVERILVENKKVKGIYAGKEMDFHKVVSNADVFHTYQKLLPGQPAPTRILKQERSSSAFIFYWGMNKEFPGLDVHNIFFSSDYKEEFRVMSEDLSIAADATVYVNISSKACRSHAPEGCENWFVMVNAPSNAGQSWDSLQQTIRENILLKLEKSLGTNVREHIVYEEVLTPEMIEMRTGSYRGSLYGTSSNNRFAAFLRHSNFGSVKGLYFCGGSVHPGGGIPMVMNSARIVEENI